MHAVIHRLVLIDASRQAELVNRLSEGLLPDLAAGSSLAPCHVVVGDGGEVVYVALFDDRTSAEAGAVLAATWMRRYVAPLVTGEPEILLGEVVYP